MMKPEMIESGTSEADLYLTDAEWVFVSEHLHDDVRALALKRLTGLRVAKVLGQLAGYQDACRKLPSWTKVPQLLYPPRLSLEQCSSEQTARYKAALLDNLGNIERMADLTGGFGVDFYFMAQNRPGSIYLERQSELCKVVTHNFSLLGLKDVRTLNEDGPSWMQNQLGSFDLIYLDPARRDARGSKVYALSDCEPDLTHWRKQLLNKTRYLLVKLSPMLDISLALSQLPETTSVHVVSVDGECKELLFLLSSEVAVQDPELVAVNLLSTGTVQQFCYYRSEESAAAPLYVHQPLTYLYEPNASLLKAGTFNLLCFRYRVSKLHPNSHLYTSDECVADFPGRMFRVERCFSVQKKDVQQHLGPAMKANLAVRNFPESVESLRKRLKISDGGSVYLFATTLYNQQKVFIQCCKINR